jgi:hypothetical protein
LLHDPNDPAAQRRPARRPRRHAARRLGDTAGRTGLWAGAQGFAYAFPVSTFRFSSQGQTLQMAYIDVRPHTPNGQTVLVMQGQNFCAGTWEGTIRTHSAYHVAIWTEISAGSDRYCRLE